jgi:Ca-activated chloride channel family protein
VRASAISDRVFSYLFLILLASLFLGHNAEVFAQGRARSDSVKQDAHGSSPKPPEPIHLDVNLALVSVTVSDSHHRLVNGLEQDDFRVFEDNVEQEIVHFSSEDVPISIGVIFDTSGSMLKKLVAAQEAAVQFFKTANPQDEFFLVNFNDRAELTSSFTNSIEDLQARMLYMTAKGRTALLDAIYLGLQQMRDAHHAKRALLIISDGQENHSRYNENDIERLVKESDCQLYWIGICDLVGYRKVNGPSFLRDITEMTGGRVFPTVNRDELPDIGAEIGIELRNQYLLGYRPGNTTHDGRWRRIKVKLRPLNGLRQLNVFAKTGYYAVNK